MTRGIASLWLFNAITTEYHIVMVTLPEICSRVDHQKGLTR